MCICTNTYKNKKITVSTDINVLLVFDLGSDPFLRLVQDLLALLLDLFGGVFGSFDRLLGSFLDLLGHSASSSRESAFLAFLSRNFVDSLEGDIRLLGRFNRVPSRGNLSGSVDGRGMAAVNGGILVVSYAGGNVPRDGDGRLHALHGSSGRVLVAKGADTSSIDADVLSRSLGFLLQVAFHSFGTLLTNGGLFIGTAECLLELRLSIVVLLLSLLVADAANVFGSLRELSIGLVGN